MISELVVATGVEEPEPITLLWIGILTAVTVLTIVVTIVWTRRARRQETLHPPTDEEENFPAGGRSHDLRVTATGVLIVMSAVLVAALVVFTVGRILVLV